MLRMLRHDGCRTCLRQGVLLQLAVQDDIEPNADQGPDNVQEPVKHVGKGCAVLGGGLEVIVIQLPRLFIPNDGRQKVLQWHITAKSGWPGLPLPEPLSVTVWLWLSP